jgi:hypothetical protein
VAEKNGLNLFADVHEGEELFLMRGRVEALTARAGRTAGVALNDLPRESGSPIGALVVFCGGSMLSILDEMEAVTAGLTDAFGDIPYLGLFSFGEQGWNSIHGNRHGNLMISVTVFGG